MNGVKYIDVNFNQNFSKTLFKWLLIEPYYFADKHNSGGGGFMSMKEIKIIIY